MNVFSHFGFVSGAKASRDRQALFKWGNKKKTEFLVNHKFNLNLKCQKQQK